MKNITIAVKDTMHKESPKVETNKIATRTIHATVFIF